MRITISKYIDIALGLIVLYGVLYNYTALISLITDVYHPVRSDEYFYFVNTESFILNDTLRAALTFTGNGSPFFGTDSHGFGYPLLHGVIGNIFGWSNLNFIYFNFIVLLIAIVLICLMESITVSQKLWITCIILLFPFCPLYAFTFMQEMIHVFIAIVISILLYRIYMRDDNKNYILIFIGVIFVAAIFRILWFFWLIGLIPLAKTKREFIKYNLLFISGIVFSFVFVKLFAEPASNYFSSVVQLLKEGNVIESISSVSIHFIENIKLYFNGKDVSLVYTFIKYINFGIVAFFSFDAIKNKTKSSMAVALIGVINFVLLFFLYDAFGWREIRTLSPLFYFHVIFIVTKTKSIIKYIQVAGLGYLFFLTLETSNQWILDRNSVNVQRLKKEKMIYQEIATKIPDSSTILIAYFPRDNSLDLLNLPLKTINDSPIRYIVRYQKVKIGDYDYILSRPEVRVSNRKIIENKHYILFEK